MGSDSIDIESEDLLLTIISAHSLPRKRYPVLPRPVPHHGDSYDKGVNLSTGFLLARRLLRSRLR